MARAASLLLAVLVLAAGCGGGGDEEMGGTPNPVDSSHPGAAVFKDAGCGDCHALTAAGSSGTTGPNLDQAAPDEETVVRQVTNGGNGMPSFRGQLTRQEIRDVAAFVAQATKSATPGESVTGPFKPDDTELEDCDDQGFSCYEQAFGNLAYKQGPKAALEVFEEQMASNSTVRADCHRIAHAIGGAALARYDGKVGRPFAEGSAACASGYYHGLLERAFLGTDKRELGTVAARLCADAEIRRVAFVAYQCVHGLGHGLMIYTGYDMPLSLRTCDQLPSEFDQVSCTGGVFMENANSSYGVKSPWLRENDLIYPCNVVAERHKYYCYLLVTSRILPAVGGSFRRTARVCLKSERDWIGECFESFGRDVSGRMHQDPRRIPPLCRLAGRYERDCIYGAVRDIANNDAAGTRAAQLCKRVGPAVRPNCYRGIGTILGALHTYGPERRRACAVVTPTRYRADCEQGAGL